jgi:hypothetical protein
MVVMNYTEWSTMKSHDLHVKLFRGKSTLFLFLCMSPTNIIPQFSYNWCVCNVPPPFVRLLKWWSSIRKLNHVVLAVVMIFKDFKKKFIFWQILVHHLNLLNSHVHELSKIQLNLVSSIQLLCIFWGVFWTCFK